MENRPAFIPGSGADGAAGAVGAAVPGGAVSGSVAGVGGAVLEEMTEQLRGLSRRAVSGAGGMVEPSEEVLFASRVEELSRTVEHLQVVAAGRLEQVRTEAETAGRSASWISADGARVQEYRHTSDYLRQALRIGRGEASKRLRLAAVLLPSVGMSGNPVPPAYEFLAEAAAGGGVPGKAATTVTMALRKTGALADPGTLARMEESLTAAAAEHDPDFVSMVATRWMNHIDQDGPEPSEEVLRHRQGIFTRAKRAGLHHLEIFATDDQYEHLITTVNAAANPRARSCGAEEGGNTTTGADHTTGSNNTASDGGAGEAAGADAGAGSGFPGGSVAEAGQAARDAALDSRTRAQKLLEGLVAACKAALATGGMPSTGGHRPQVMAVIDYQDLINDLETNAGGSTDMGTGSFTFTGPVTAANIRQLACDAEIMPVILSSEGRILDAGPGQRLFPPHLRKALIARDGGCAFPGCYMPASWCEAHHIDYWSKKGATSTDNGAMLCSFHHHLIHKEKWRIHVENGVPWFIPPPYVDPYQKPLRNHYFDRRPHMAGGHQTRLPLPATG